MVFDQQRCGHAMLRIVVPANAAAHRRVASVDERCTRVLGHVHRHAAHARRSSRRDALLTGVDCDDYRGAMRMAPSRRMVSPLSIGFSTICTARLPYSRGIAEPRRMRHLRAEALAGFLVQSHQQRRQEQAGRDGVDADLQAGEIARRRQGHADHATLRGRIGDLPDLAFIGRDTRGVDGDAALFPDRGGRRQPLGEQPQHVEGADQIDVDDAHEFCQRIDAVLADDALRAADAGAVHQHAGDAMRAFGFRQRRLDLLLVGDVGMQGDTLHFGRDLFGVFLALVEHADFCPFGGHGARGGGAEAGASAGDDNGNVFQLHGLDPLLKRFFRNFAFLDGEPFAATQPIRCSPVFLRRSAPPCGGCIAGTPRR